MTEAEAKPVEVKKEQNLDEGANISTKKEEVLMGIDKLGDRYYFHKGKIEVVSPRDVLARLAVAGSLALSGISLAWTITTGRDAHDGQLAAEARYAEVQSQLDNVEAGACFNERVLRNALGAPDIDLAGCIAEWDEVGQKMRETPTPTPEATPAPQAVQK